MGLPSYPWRFVHLAALWGYGVSQPVFSLLKGNPEFLVFTGASRVDTTLFAVLLAFGPALLCILVELAVGFVSQRAGAVVHLLALWLFGALAALQVVAKFDPTSSWTMLVPAVAAYAGAIAYARWAAVRAFLSLSFALPIVGLLVFLSATPSVVGDVRQADVNVVGQTPVVLVVLDELPLSSLMTGSGSIDGQRYPGFGELARDSTWYSRATTVADHTTYAVPAILSGQVPDNTQLPTLSDYPHNLFTLLGGPYTVRAQEPVTRLCPVRYCPQQRSDVGLISRLRQLFRDVGVDYLAGALPADARGDLVVAEGWRVSLDSTRIEGLDFVRSMGSGDPLRTFYFLHLLQPHQPWALLPSGHDYNDPWVVAGVTDDWDPGEDKRWRANQLLVEEALQHHLLQLGAVDRLIGGLLAQLKRRGLYNRSLIIVTADHGASFRANGWIRRTTFDNVSDIAAVPLFVKYPGEKGGREDRRAAETVDILPTVADVLDITVPWPDDGTSLRATPIARSVRVARLKRQAIVVSPERIASGVLATAKRNATWLGEGKRSIYRIGPRRDLLGTTTSTLPVAAADARVSIPLLPALEDVRKGSGHVPAHFVGQITWDALRPAEVVAIAINGRFEAMTTPFRSDGGAWIDAMINEEHLREGWNSVEVYAVRGRGAATNLLLLGGNVSRGLSTEATPGG